MEGHIYIYGEITSYQGKDAVNYGAVNPREVQDQLQANKESKEIIVHVNSPGGDVDAGFAIFDILKSSGKTITTIIEGQCYSIATVIALAGSVRKATQNSEFLIHNPWTMAFGNADEVQKTADELRKFEDKIANHYSSIVNISVETALEEMKKDTYMDLEKAMEYGFITEIIDTLKAVAKFSTNNNKNIMEESKKDGFWSKLRAAFESVDEKPQPKSLVAKSATGEDVVFNDRTEGEIQVGDKATVNGETAEGEILMANGDTYIFAKGGELESIKEKEVEQPIDVNALVTDAVNKATESFEAKLTERDVIIGELKSELSKNTKIFENLKNLASDNVADTTDVRQKTSDKDEKVKGHVLSLTTQQKN